MLVVDREMDGVADNVDERKSREALFKFFCAGMMRPQIGAVIKDNRIKILEMLKPQSQLSMETIGCKCLKLYEEERAKLKVILRDFDGQISLSADILRSGKHYKRGSEYLCLTAHLIDDNWELRRYVLNFSLIGLEGGGLFHEIVLDSLRYWDIENKIFTITMLNSDRYNESLEIVKNHIHGKREFQLQLNDQLFRVDCCADVLRLMVLDAYESISDIVEQIGNKYDFKDALPTWNNRSNQLKESFYLKYVQREIRAYYQLPSDKRWDKVSDIIDLVDDVYDIAFPLLELGYPTSNIFLHQLQELQSHLANRSANRQFVRGVTLKILEKLNKYMKDMYLVMAVASVLDPCFKTKWIEFSSAKFEGADGNSQLSYVLETLSNLYDEYAIQYPVTESITKDPECNIEEKIGLQLLREYKQFLKSTKQPKKTELTSYMDEPVSPWTEDFNALSWWKAENVKYPVLARMARDFLAIPITITIKDDALYMKQRKADPSVITLKPDLMNALMSMRSWFLEA